MKSMKVMLDTNVVLDVLCQREPFFQDSAQVLNQAERGEFRATLCATTLTTIFYLLARQSGDHQAKKKIHILTSFCSVAEVGHRIILQALQSEFQDFEDGVLHYSAQQAGAECIVTRNQKDFKHSSLRVFTPTEFIKLSTP